MPGLPHAPAPADVVVIEATAAPLVFTVVETWLVVGAVVAFGAGVVMVWRTKRAPVSAATSAGGAAGEPVAADDTRYCPVVASAIAGGVGLTGPHAASAARAIVALTLTDHHALVPGATVVITSSTLDELGPGADVDAVPQLHVHDTMTSLLDEVTGALSDRASQAGVHPAMLIVTDHANKDLEEILERGRTVGIGGIVVGAADFPRTFWVHPDGRLELVTSARCGILSRQTFAACLTTLQHTATVAAAAPVAGPIATPSPALATTADSPADRLGAPGSRDKDSDPCQPPLELRLLGGIELWYAGEPVRLSRVKSWELLAMIASSERGCRKAALMETLVADTVHNKARGHLNALVSHTRRELRDRTGCTNADFIVHTTTGSGWCLADDQFTIDIARFDSDLAAADTATDPDARASHLHAAVSAYGGPFAAGLFSETTWHEPLRNHYQNAAHRAAISLADHRRSRGDLHAAAAALERATDIDGGSRTAYERLVTVHRERGDATAAARAQRQLDTLE